MPQPTQLARDKNNVPIQGLALPDKLESGGGAVHNVTIDGTARVMSSPVGQHCKAVRVHVTVQCHICRTDESGTLTADTNDTMMEAGDTDVFKVTPGKTRFGFIQSAEAVAGSADITELE